MNGTDSVARLGAATWELVSSAGEAVREESRRLVAEGRDRMVDAFYAELLEHTEARRFIRYGGDEFVVLLADMTAAGLRGKAETLRQKAAEIRVEVGQGVRAGSTVSVGAVLFDGHPDYEHVMLEADRALYEAKRRGGDCSFLVVPED